ncbi:hypothetical protein GCM10010390_29110 [Streptomyces mordarskii]|uniref:Uncharacterized protein n=1 Tax=Streptomyces mordarskii TaxID=1226758 RepID=A0ABN1CSB0_9ACTN
MSRWLGRRSAWCWSGGGRNVGESLQELVEGGLSVVDSSAFVVSERDARERLLNALSVPAAVAGPVNPPAHRVRPPAMPSPAVRKSRRPNREAVGRASLMNWLLFST